VRRPQIIHLQTAFTEYSKLKVVHIFYLSGDDAVLSAESLKCMPAPKSVPVTWSNLAILPALMIENKTINSPIERPLEEDSDLGYVGVLES
jgi:hypothetical protein